MAGQGTKILASDYNVVQSAISTVLGTGSGTNGYGQAVTSSQLVGNPTITVTQWNNLRNDLLKAYLHQGSPSNLTVPSAPSTSTKVTATDYANYLALSNTIAANALVTPPVGQASLTTISSGTRTTAWNGTVTHTVTLTFASNNEARYFFNSGGSIKFFGSLTGLPAGSSLIKSQDWAMILANMKTISMNYNGTTCTGSYSSIAPAIGFYQLTTTPISIFSKVAASPTYSPNKYEIFASVDSTSSPSILTFSIAFQDLSAPGGFGIDENVQGTLNSSVQAYYASGSNVSVNLPAVTASMTGGTVTQTVPSTPYVATLSGYTEIEQGQTFTITISGGIPGASYTYSNETDISGSGTLDGFGSGSVSVRTFGIGAQAIGFFGISTNTTSVFNTTVYYENISLSSSGRNTPITLVISGGVPNSAAFYTGPGSGTVNLNSSGAYSGTLPFTLSSGGTFTFTFNFSGSHGTRTATLTQA